MKKIFFIGMGMLLFTGLFACNKSYDGKTAYQIYELSNEKNKSIKSMTIFMEGTVGTLINNESTNTGLDGTVKMIMKGENDFDMEMNINSGVMGEQFNITAYYLDGLMYMDFLGMKIKMPLEAVKAASMSYSQTIAFPESAVSKQSAKEEGDDIKISFTLKGDAMNEILIPMMSNLTESMGTVDTNAIVFKDINYEMLLSKDYTIKKYRIAFDTDIGNPMGGFIFMSYDITAYITDIDSTIISLPDNIDEYTEFGTNFNFDFNLQMDDDMDYDMDDDMDFDMDLNMDYDM